MIIIVQRYDSSDDVVSHLMIGIVSIRRYTYGDFETLANKAFVSRFCSSGSLPSSYMEKLFWHEMENGEMGTVEYGVNVEGSAFS